jgi:nitrogen fixation-related uncharacterized protein
MAPNGAASIMLAMSKSGQSDDDNRMDHEHLIHLLSDYESGALSTTEENLAALRAEIAELEARLGLTDPIG